MADGCSHPGAAGILAGPHPFEPPLHASNQGISSQDLPAIVAAWQAQVSFSFPGFALLPLDTCLVQFCSADLTNFVSSHVATFVICYEQAPFARVTF